MKSHSVCLITLSTVAFAGGTHACEPEKAAVETAGIDLRWIDSKLVVYGIDDRELYEARLDSPQRTTLLRLHGRANHGLAISPDGRYLAYDVGRRKDDSIREYHLFDLATRKDRVVPVLPKPDHDWEVEFLGFSPDSQTLVWLDDDGYAVPGTTISRPELVVFSTQDLARRALPFPAPSPQSQQSRSCFTPQWSADGSALLVNSMEGYCSHLAKDEGKLAYHRIDLASGESRAVEGGYSFDKKQYFFRSFYVDHGRRVDQAYPCLDSHRCHAYDQGVESGSSRAWLQHVSDPHGTTNGPEELYVQTTGTAARKIAIGYSSFCAGTDIGLVEWVEAGKYLLYQYQGNTYLHAVAEGRTVVLPQLTGAYNWLPLGRTDRLYYIETEGNGDETRYGPASPIN